MRGIKRPWTADEDAYLLAHYGDTTLHALGAHFGCPWTQVQTRVNRLIAEGRLVRRARAYQPDWTEAEIERLTGLWGLEADATVARRLGRSVLACALKAKRLGVRKTRQAYTCRAVADIFAVDSHVVLRWIRQGWLAAGRAGFRMGPEQVWRIDEEAIRDFLRAHPDAYDASRIERDAPGYWRAQADAVRRAQPTPAPLPPPRAATRWTAAEDAALRQGWGREPDATLAARLGRTVPGCEHRAGKLAIWRCHGLTPDEVARRLGIGAGTVRGAIRRGELAATRGPVGAARPYYQIAPAEFARWRGRLAAGSAAGRRGGGAPHADAGADLPDQARPLAGLAAVPPGILPTPRLPTGATVGSMAGDAAR